MLTLVITAILAGAFAFFATQNTMSVDVNFGNYSLQMPLYLVVIVPLILGLLASYFIYIAYSLSLKLTINEQKDELKKVKEENTDLTKSVHKLELENTKMKSQNGHSVDEDSI